MTQPDHLASSAPGRDERPARPPRASPSANPRPAGPGDRSPGPGCDDAPARFTVDGDDALERHLARCCKRIAAGLRGLIPEPRLEGIALGGGYGRGEGGVLRTAQGDRPYNDLEFYVFLRGNRHLNQRRYGRAVHVLGEILTPQAGIDVEFHLASLRAFTAAPVSMFSYDLFLGHRWLVGDDSLFAHAWHHGRPGEIPAAEATRLLMNRCTGLLLARERLERPVFSPADADFVARNIAKAQLGAGDAMLAVRGLYHRSVRERHRRLRQLEERSFGGSASLREHHAEGTQFKLHPRRAPADRHRLSAAWNDVSALCRCVWLWLEQRRLEHPFATPAEYARPEIRKCPETAPSRNALVNARVFGPRALLGRDSGRHPRERVLNTLPLLLWEREALNAPAVLARLRQELRAEAGDEPALLAAFRRIWERVN